MKKWDKQEEEEIKDYMKQVNNFRIYLFNDRKADFWQEDNGIYRAEIRDKFNMVESAGTFETLSQAQSFIEKHK